MIAKGKFHTTNTVVVELTEEEARTLLYLAGYGRGLATGIRDHITKQIPEDQLIRVIDSLRDGLSEPVRNIDSVNNFTREMEMAQWHPSQMAVTTAMRQLSERSGNR